LYVIKEIKVRTTNTVLLNSNAGSCKNHPTDTKVAGISTINI